MIDYKRDIVSLVAADFDKMDALILQGATSKVELVMKVSKHVVDAGGKRMRPLMTLLAGRACNPALVDIPHLNTLATIVEMLHTATLVHDDVVDESSLRRGVPTANASWNNATAVLVGDFLIARSFDLLVDIANSPLLKLFSTGTCDIAEGEVLQLQLQHNPNIDEQAYFDMIHGKTSRLFEVATEGAAVLVNADYRDALHAYACHFGNAFQIMDDVLDYTSDAATLGKNIGDDLAEGKPTLPLVAALRFANLEEQALIKDSIKYGKVENLSRIVSIVKSSNALTYCLDKAKSETELALSALTILPPSTYREGLANLAKLALSRNS